MIGLRNLLTHIRLIAKFAEQYAKIINNKHNEIRMKALNVCIDFYRCAHEPRVLIISLIDLHVSIH